MTFTGALLAACSNASTTQLSEKDASEARNITVAAASDLRPAFEELVPSFTTASGIDVTFSFGSSGQLREQIKNGAPFDVFASANTDFASKAREEAQDLQQQMDRCLQEKNW